MAVTIRALNSLPENPKLRLYRALIPVQVLAEFDINPRTWKNSEKVQQVKLEAEQGSDKVKIRAWYGDDPQNEFFYLELADNQYNGIDLNFLIANDPTCEKYKTDYDEAGNETLFGTVRRNLPEEEKAMRVWACPRADP
ncbi:MAG: hypothetical protein QM730_21685 [Anaerolineales bacterium]